MSHNPFTRPKPNPKRTKPRRVQGRTRLDHEGLKALRLEVFARSGGRCEETTYEIGLPLRCGKLITWGTMELSHRRHGPNKSDEASEVIASCRECHRARHAGGNGKPCPRKAGRKMTKAEAMQNWKGDVCFCGVIKRPETSLCPACLEKLDPQLSFDVQRATGEDYLRAMALAEQALLAWSAK